MPTDATITLPDDTFVDLSTASREELEAAAERCEQHANEWMSYASELYAALSVRFYTQGD